MTKAATGQDGMNCVKNGGGGGADRADRAGPAADAAADAAGIAGRTILVAEDEMVLAMMLEDMLQDAGCQVVCAPSVGRGLELANGREFDAAVLDVNLNGVRSYVLADRLAERGVPYLFATGYGDADLRARYPGRPIVAKPYLDREIVAALASVLRPPQD